MIDVYMEHNPYKPLTSVKLDEKPVAPNSKLNYRDRPFQEWVEDLPKDLCEETGDNEFELTFHGTVLDYEDLQSVAEAAKKKDIHITCKHEPAKEASDKMEAIEGIFWEIIDNPYFPDLKTDAMWDAYKNAKGKEFPVNVVATMSSGKSTLINALLGQKLMPAKQQACTATITELWDNDNSDHFVASVYGKNGQLMKFVDPLTLAEMEKLNTAEVSKIVAKGDIPFVSSDDAKLVLVDTPGPNNVRNSNHQKATRTALSSSSKTLVLYVLNASQLATNDDYTLLKEVAESMKVGGKPSRDRFIFVLNKMDDFKAGEDSVESALKAARDYLTDRGIEDPNIYPASALTALALRSDFRDVEVKESSIFQDIYGNPQRRQDPAFMDTMSKITSLNYNPDLHLEKYAGKYAHLAPSAQKKIQEELNIAVTQGDLKEQALIHSGIKSIEAAISVHVEKYAKAAKIRGVVNTFYGMLESQQCFEKTRKEIAENQDKQAEIQQIIQAIEDKINDGEAAKAFQSVIDKQCRDCVEDARAKGQKVIQKANKEIRNQIVEGRKKSVEAASKGNEKPKKGVSEEEAKEICAKFEKFANDLLVQTSVSIESSVNQTVANLCEVLTKEYEQRLASFSEEISISSVSIDPVKILSGKVDSAKTATLIDDATETEEIVNRVWVPNYDKAWWKFWTWFQEDGHWRDEHEKRKYVDFDALANMFFAPVQKDLHNYQTEVVAETQKRIKKIQQDSMKRFNELDQVLKDKLAELNQCVASKADAEEQCRQIEERLKWLEGIKARVDAILNI